MAKLYTFLLILICPLSIFAFNNDFPTHPTDPDSAAMMPVEGHERCTTHVKVNCTTRTIELTAHVDFLFTGATMEVVAPWSTGQNVHKIIVTPPGSWSWDVTGFGCDHITTLVDLDGTFFNGQIDVTAPPAICSGQQSVEINVNTQGYTFDEYNWTPSNDPLTPITVTQAGTYSLLVRDDFGCPFMDQVTINQYPPFVPQLSTTQFICPENDTAFVNVTQPYVAYEWSTGDTGNPLMITEPGLYEVTVTNTNGCTGNSLVGVQSGGVETVLLSATKPAICPGQLDTLRVLGGFLNIAWSNGATTNNNIVNQAGTYTVTVTNIHGCTKTAEYVIDPLFPPVIQATAPPLCQGFSTTIGVTGGNFPQYAWSPGQSTSSITISTPGTYTVTVSGNNICPATATVTVPIAAPPLTSVLPPGQLTCTNTQLTLDGTGSSSGANFGSTWSTVGGNILSGQNSLQPLINGAGVYTLTILDNTNGCTSSASVTVNQNTQVPVANAGLPATLTCIVSDTMIGPATPPANPNYVPTWTTSNGNIVSGPNTWNPLVNQPGIYVLTVNDTAIGCSAISSVTIDLDIATPVAQISPPGVLSCTVNSTTLNGFGSSSGNNFNYQWSTVNGSLSGVTNSISATAAAIGTYQLLVTNSITGCTATTTVDVTSSTILPVAVAAPTPLLTCTVQDITIDATASSSGTGYNYNWTTVSGNIQSGSNTLTPVVTQPGVYTLVLVNTANNCTATIDVNVSDDVAPPAAVAGPDMIISCGTPTQTLNGNTSASGPGITYLWSTSSGNILNGNTTLTPEIDQAGTYELLVTNQNNGCTATSTVLVQGDFTPPTVAIVPPAILTCVDTDVVLDGSGSSQGAGYTYAWSGIGIIAGQGTPQLTVNQPDTYTLLITDFNNGCTREEEVVVLQNISTPTAEAGPDLIINCDHPTGIIGSSNNPAGLGFDLQWTTVGGNFTTPVNGPTATINAPGTYQLLITATANGCTATDNLQVVSDFVPPMADAGITAELNCIQNTVSLTGTGSTGPNFVYQWSTIGGNIQSGPNTLTPLVNAAGTYNLLITNTVNGCTTTDQVIITQSADVPVAVAGTPQTLTCAVTTTSLNGAGSTSGLNYVWSTGTGNIVNGGTTLTPTIDAPGTYLLTVVNPVNNCSAVSSVIIAENVQNPVVNAGLDQILTCTVSSLPLGAQIVTSFSPNITYAWSTTGGTIVSGNNSASPTISATGTYLVTVTDNANGCTGTDQLVVNNDLNQPVALIAPPATLTCSTLQTGISTTGSSTGSNYVYNWTTVGGNFVSLANPAQPQINQPGTYNLLITNTDNGCTQTASVVVPQDITIPAAEAGPTAILNCDITSLNLDGNNSSQGTTFAYIWTTNDGQLISGITSLVPQIGAPGTYQLSVTNTQNGCSETDNVVITQDITPPVAAVSTPGILTCLVGGLTLQTSTTNPGPAPTYSWTTSNGNITSGATTQAPAVNAPGLYTLVVENTNNGCTATASIQVNQNITPPTAQIQPPGILNCTVEEVTINSTVSPSTTVVWTTADGNIISGANSLAPVVDAPGLYVLSVTSTVNGCTTSAQIPVGIEGNVPTGLDWNLVPPLCNGTPGLLTVEQITGGIGPFQYSVNGGQTYFPAQDIDNLQPGVYDLVIRDINGCTLTEIVDVPEPPTPLVNLPPQFKIELGENQELQAVVPAGFPLALIDTVIWSPLDGLTFSGTSIAQMLNPVAQPFKTTSYEVTIITPEGCKATSRTVVEVDRRLHIYAPNVINLFDDNNNTFTIFSSDAAVLEIRLLQVFDRWGAMVFQNTHFQPNDPSAGWKGDHRSEQVDPAVFVWQAEVLLVDGNVQLLTGDVTVVR